MCALGFEPGGILLVTEEEIFLTWRDSSSCSTREEPRLLQLLRFPKAVILCKLHYYVCAETMLQHRLRLRNEKTLITGATNRDDICLTF